MTEPVAIVTAVRTGRVQTVDWGGRKTPTGAIKSPQPNPVHLDTLGFDGDEQGDLKVHGGPDKAALVYAEHHYPAWSSEQDLDFAEGSFFENLTLRSVGPEPLDETTVRLGETWRVGTAVVQVSQHRSPCWKLARQWDVPDLVQRVQQTGWSGWYLRVLEPGEVAAGDPVVILDRPANAPTVAEIGRVMTRDKHDLDAARRLLEFDGLPGRMRHKLESRLEGALEDDSRRLQGPTD